MTLEHYVKAHHGVLSVGALCRCLVDRHDDLRGKGVEVNNTIDHDWARSFYFRDPNGLSLEYCTPRAQSNCRGRKNAVHFTLSRTAPEFGNAIEATPPRHRMAGRRAS
jgi:catechol-2,3-dioxygenase